MSVWLTIPSKRPPEEAEPVLKQWRERGYEIALFFDSLEDALRHSAKIHRVSLYVGPDRWRTEPTDHYPGYALAVNWLVKAVTECDETAEWFIAAGDDVEPDLNHSAEEIARECCEHFLDVNMDRNDHGFGAYPEVTALQMKTLGVMQCTGDRWGEDPNAQDPKMRSAYIDRVAGSAWIGREFAKRVNQGRGPLWPEYFHMGVDEELQAVAQMLGVFWQRPDLIQLHKHWGRAKEGEVMGHRRNMPKFLERANSAEEWDKYKALFAKRQAAGFPGSELL